MNMGADRMARIRLLEEREAHLEKFISPQRMGQVLSAPGRALGAARNYGREVRESMRSERDMRNAQNLQNVGGLQGSTPEDYALDQQVARNEAEQKRLEQRMGLSQPAQQPQPNIPLPPTAASSPAATGAPPAMQTPQTPPAPPAPGGVPQAGTPGATLAGAAGAAGAAGNVTALPQTQPQQPAQTPAQIRTNQNQASAAVNQAAQPGGQAAPGSQAAGDMLAQIQGAQYNQATQQAGKRGGIGMNPLAIALTGGLSAAAQGLYNAGQRRQGRAGQQQAIQNLQAMRGGNAVQRSADRVEDMMASAERISKSAAYLRYRGA